MSFASDNYRGPTLVFGPNNSPPAKGYHVSEIPKGVLGTPSKITEEYLEFMDACEQNNPVMQLVELSDMLGAIDAFASSITCQLRCFLL